MSYKHKCAVWNCQSENSKLFQCPKSRSQSKKWKNILGVSEKEFYVCELHFDASFINYEKVLNDEAIPTIFMNDKLQVNQYCACCSSPISEGHQIGQLHLQIHSMLFSSLELNGEFICSKCNDKMIEISDFVKIVEDNRRNFDCVDVKEPVIKIEPLDDEMLIQDGVKEVEENMLFIKSELNAIEPEEQSHVSGEDEPKLMKRKAVNQNFEFICMLCSIQFDTRKQLSDHVIGTHGCEEENKKPEKPKKPGTKTRSKYQKCIIKCPDCEKKIRYCTYKSHVLSFHSKKRDLICEQCGKEFGIIYALQAHIKQMHERVTYECDICGYTCWVKYRIKTHINETHNETYMKYEAKKCPICHKIQHINFNAHMKKYHSDNYDSGIRVNPETNKYHCPNCIQTFKSIHFYNKHIDRKVCENIEKFEVDDEKTLTTRTVGKFTCGICKSVKTTLVSLRKHMTTFHTGKRTCLICNRTQKHQRQFQKHVNTFHKISIKEYRAKIAEMGHVL